MTGGAANAAAGEPPEKSSAAAGAHSSPRTPLVRNHVEARLRELIAELDIGVRIPGERDLAARFQVARMTVRRAVDALVGEGRLERRQGAGTFIAERPVVRKLDVGSLTRDLRRRGLRPNNEVLSLRTVEASESLAARFRIREGAALFRFARLRWADGQPLALETVWLRREHVPELTVTDLTDSLYDFLAERWGLLVSTSTATIQSVQPSANTARLLRIPIDQPCLRVSSVESDAEGTVLILHRADYRGDRYQLKASLPG